MGVLKACCEKDKKIFYDQVTSNEVMLEILSTHLKKNPFEWALQMAVLEIADVISEANRGNDYDCKKAICLVDFMEGLINYYPELCSQKTPDNKLFIQHFVDSLQASFIPNNYRGDLKNILNSLEKIEKNIYDQITTDNILDKVRQDISNAHNEAIMIFNGNRMQEKISASDTQNQLNKLIVFNETVEQNNNCLTEIFELPAQNNQFSSSYGRLSC